MDKILNKISIGRMVKYSSILIVFVAVILFFSTSAKAASGKEKTVRIGYYPVSDYQDKDEDGNYARFSYEYYVQIQKYTEWNFDFVEAGYAECMKMLADGEIDIVSGVVPTDERKESMDFSLYSISNTQNKLYARADDADMFYESFESFDGAKVAVMRGALTNSLTDYAEEHDFSIQLCEYDTSADMEAALLNGEVRLVYSTSITSTANTKIVARFEKIPLNYAVSKKTPEILDELDYALQKIVDNNPDFYTQMSDKYMVSGANAVATFTKEEYDYIQSEQPVYVIMNNDWNPICWYDEKKNIYQGIIVGILDKLSEYSGLQFICCNETEFNTMAQEKPEIINDVLAILSDDVAWASKQSVVMSNRILDSSVVLVTKRGAEHEIDSETMRYALPERFYVSWKVAKKIPEKQITYYSTIQECMDAVNEGKADATYMNEHVASYYLSMLQYSDLYTTAGFDVNENLAFAINKDTDKPLLGILDKTLMCISEYELTQIVVENSVAEQRVSLRGLFYSNPTLFILIIVFVILILAAIIFVAVMFHVKHRRLSYELVKEQESATARTEFFMMISHEIRTPLNAIAGYLDMAVSLCQDNRAELGYLKRSQHAAKQLTSVAQNMLDYTDIESSRAEIHTELFDLKNVVRQISENTAFIAEKKNVNFKISVKDIEHEFVIGDELRISQIMEHILSNAVKFTQSGGIIEASIQEKLVEKGLIEVCFSARDTGKGMSEEFLRKVCAPFNQSDPSYSRTHGGLGLGLYLTKYYLDVMDGHMEVKSKLGEGTLFTIYIPLQLPDSEQLLSQDIDYSHIRALICGEDEEENKALKTILKRLKVKCDTFLDMDTALKRIKTRLASGYGYNLCIVDEEKITQQENCLTDIYNLSPKMMVFILSDGIGTMNSQKIQCAAYKFLGRPVFQSELFDAVISNFGAYETKEKSNITNYDGVSALIAEDNEVNADILARILKKMNVISKVCENGQIAAETFENAPVGEYDIIFMDIQMPVMNGYDATRRIRSGENGANIPIIAVSANAFAEDVENSLKSGMNEHLSKPIDIYKIGETIAKYVINR